VRAEPHDARVGGDLAKHQPQQRRLPRAVGPDQADAVAALHDRVELANDDALAPRLRHADELDDEPTRAFACVDRERRAPEARAARRALASQLLEPPHATLVARAARFDPL